MERIVLDGGDPVESQLQFKPARVRYGNYRTSRSESFGTGSETKITTTRGAGLRQWTYSFDHPVRFLGRAKTNIGGKFLTVKSQVLSSPEEFNFYRNYGGSPPYETSWKGELYANYDTTQLLREAEKSRDAEYTFLSSKVPPDTDFNLDGYGATAVARCAPTNPLVDLSSGLAELYREGLPAYSPSSNIGGHYLNTMFGVVPLAGDISSAVQVARRSDELLQQFERDAGRWVRRKYRFPETADTSVVTRNSMLPSALTSGNAPSGAFVQPGTLTVTTTTRRQIWFSGAFCYHLPKGGWRRTVAELDYLYGIKPGVDTAWNLTPMSWLVDYFSNVGDVMSNINAFTNDGLVMPYGYIMMSKDITVISDLEFSAYSQGGFGKTRLQDVVTYTVKQRRLANPFGFGFSGDLNPRQMSILAALGISTLAR